MRYGTWKEASENMCVINPHRTFPEGWLLSGALNSSGSNNAPRDWRRGRTKVHHMMASSVYGRVAATDTSECNPVFRAWSWLNLTLRRIDVHRIALSGDAQASLDIFANIRFSTASKGVCMGQCAAYLSIGTASITTRKDLRRGIYTMKARSRS